jgi:hypothetical protein
VLLFILAISLLFNLGTWPYTSLGDDPYRAQQVADAFAGDDGEFPDLPVPIDSVVHACNFVVGPPMMPSVSLNAPYAENQFVSWHAALLSSAFFKRLERPPAFRSV